MQCNKTNVLPLPTVAKIENRQLLLQGYTLNEGICKAIKQYLKLNNNCISKLALDNNSLSDKILKQILKGIASLEEFRNLIICNNAVGA